MPPKPPTNGLPPQLCTPGLKPHDPLVPKANGWHTWREVVQRTNARPPQQSPKTGIWG